MKHCPLCMIPDREVLADFPRWKLVRTKTMKGHKERLMVLRKLHVKDMDEQSVGEAYMLLLTMGQKFFAYATEWAVFEPVYATVPGHWHRVASDLDPKAEDYEQILKTPRLVVDRETVSITRFVPNSEILPIDISPESDKVDGQVRRVEFGMDVTRGKER